MRYHSHHPILYQKPIKSPIFGIVSSIQVDK